MFCDCGAWVRIYGVPIHAWNINFFKLCVLDCGRLLQVDELTLDKERLDYARVMLATSSLELINTISTVVVDGAVLEFKIIEEWGCTLGEDAYLSMEEGEPSGTHSVKDDLQYDFDGDGDVDVFLQQLSNDLHDECLKDTSVSNYVQPVQHNLRSAAVDASKEFVNNGTLYVDDGSVAQTSIGLGINLAVAEIDVGVPSGVSKVNNNVEPLDGIQETMVV